MYVIGTAGHVDHGKSTLIKALTGIDPDRLPEERERGMTIDLGFAWLTLPSGREVSIVDVPGHERFVHNMLAGVGGIDMALLVIAADEGVMPQTREHLAILDLLQIKTALVTLTKSDLVDEELLEVVKSETEEVLKGTVFQGAPMTPVSAYTGQGLEEVKSKIDQMLSHTSPRQDVGRPRLAVDRSFTVAGFGTVVTGTLIDGALSAGQEVELVPSGRICRIRGLQSHRKKVERADPGRRLAVNLSGISHDKIRRGEVITTPGWLKPTTLIDAKVKLLSDAPRPLKHNAPVTFHVLASESAARVRLLDARELQPGHEAWTQIYLYDPVPVAKGDLFVLRSTETTLGGGKVVDPYPKRHRPFVASVLERIAAMEGGNLEAALLGAIDQWSPCDLATLSQRSNLALSEVLSTVAGLARQQRVLLLGGPQAQADSVVYSNQAWQTLKDKGSRILVEYHKQNPLRRGMLREELRSRLDLQSVAFNQALARLAEEGMVAEEGALLRSPQHQAAFSPDQDRQVAAYLKALESEPFSPPTGGAIDPELLALLIDTGRVVKVDGPVVFSAEAYRRMVELVTRHIKQHGKITVAEARTLLNSTRKYVLPLLEYMDQQRITRRVGDERVLR
jgi:selenocysteine-specific elongation factor